MTMDVLREILFVATATATVLTAALAGAGLLRRRSAALRSCVLAGGFLVVLALPALLPLLPAPREAGPYPAPTSMTVVPTVEAASGPAASVSGSAAHETDPAALLPLLAGIWLLGGLVTATRLVLAHRRVHELTAGARPVTGGPLARLHLRLLDDLDLPRSVRLVLAGGAPSPLTVGWWRPVVVLPPEAAAWPTDELAAVLRHELAHVRRRDNAVALAGGVIACLHWFDPVVWWALRRWRREAEVACDDTVVRRGVRPSAYARVLLARASTVSAGAAPSLAAAPFAAHVRGRLHDLLDARTDRSRPGRRTRVLVAVALLALVLPLTALRPAVHADPLEVPSSPAAEHAAGPAWWQELQAEMDEMRAINSWRRDPAQGRPLPEGVLTGDGWRLEAHDAVVLPGTKYGCVFTSDHGYLRITYADGSAFGLSAFPHPPLTKVESTLDRLLAPVGLGTGGEPRGYRIEGFRTADSVERFRGVLAAAAALASPSPTRQESP